MVVPFSLKPYLGRITQVKRLFQQLVYLIKSKWCFHWSSGISLLDVMNTWLQPLLTQVFKVVPQEAWMAVPRIFTPNIHWYWFSTRTRFSVQGRDTQGPHRGDNTHWPTKLDMVDKTSVQRRIFGCNCAAQYFSQKQLKESRKTTLLRAQYDFLGLVFSGSQSLVIKGGHWRDQRQ